MKLPRKVMRYCPHCKKHTLQEIERVKKRKASELRKGQRRFRRTTSGYGGFPRPVYEGREKPTKRINIKYKCLECKKSYNSPTWRAKKFELAEVEG